MDRQRYTVATFARELAFLVGAVIFLIPVFILVNTSLKSVSDTFGSPFTLSTPQLENYSKAWGDGVPVSISRALVNSLVITVGSVAVIVVLGSLCAYVIARRPSRWSTGVYIGILLSIVIPVQLAVPPLFVAVNKLGLTGSYLGMIIVWTGLMMPLAIFLYTGFIRALPAEYEEAARVDGAGVLRTFVRVVFPLLRPVTGTVAILTGLVVWNDFFTPLVFLGGSGKEPLPVAVYSFVGENTTDWNVIFAAVVISIIPILAFAIVAQRQLIRSFVSGIRG